MTIQPVGKVQSIAGLDCVVVDPMPQEYQPNLVVILCHGFGASGTDLVDCCRAMWELQPVDLAQVRFVFPAAPISLDPSGGYDSRAAWWPIDMERLNWMIATGQFRDLRHEQPELLPQRRDELEGLIGRVTAEAKLDPSSVVLGGFSQGAMLATDVALHLATPPAGLIVWSGTLLNESDWRVAAKRQTRFPVFQSHGRMDPILPFAAAEWLHEMFIEARFEAQFVPFDGMHEIPMPAMRGAAQLVAALAAAS
jgi:phospholipase/carboxylesterase